MSVLKFSGKPFKGQRERDAQPKDGAYYCLHCDSEVFKLFNDGTVYCAALGCGRFIANLRVTK